MVSKRLEGAYGLLLIFLFLTLFLIPKSLASINTDSAITPAKGQTVIRSLVRFQTKSGDRTGENRKMFIVENRNIGVYGLQDGTTLFTTIPFLYKELEVNNASGGPSERRDAGLGDIRVFLKQRLWRKDRLGKTDRFALLGGLKFPTGDTDEKDGLGKLPKSLQLGSGSWDPFVGPVFTHQEHRYEFSQDLVYQFNTTKGTFSFGDELSHNSGFWFRFWPWVLPEAGVPSQLQLVLEFNGVWNQKNKLDGDKMGKEGGYTLYLSPGLQWVGSWWILEGSIQFPILQDLGRDEIRNDPAYTIGIRITF